MTQVLLEWQPITGCSYHSPGCANCKTMRLAGPALREEFRRDGLMTESKAGPVWNGQVRFNEARLMQPMERRSPAYFYVVPHGDPFHENIPDEWIDRIFGVMEKCPQHQFQVLSKRAARQRDYVNRRYPLRSPANIFFGVSCERQQEADERIPFLLDTHAVVRFLTLFPIIGAMDLTRYLIANKIHTVFAGTEPEREADPEWIETIKRNCAHASVPFFFGTRLVGEALA